MVFNMALKQTSLELVLHSYLIDVIHNCHWLAHGRDFGHTRKCIDDEISKLRYELCPRVMKERKFWKIYFILVNSHVAPLHWAELCMHFFFTNQLQIQTICLTICIGLACYLIL
ncbi:uncharacterized protein LOC114279355 isoform X2 [Camellia sinensis]|uniref:uncharacterized protein LOC114279355 isoform X2 n=1 Tax=Camellia sinensis TaxID=4442 RepID=UPI001036A2C4|nr:uncharacterized protein LOC114279355 isoform X2 [Camellia sinensis]